VGKSISSRFNPHTLSRLPVGLFRRFCESQHQPSKARRSTKSSQINIGFVLSFCCAGRGPWALDVGRPRSVAGGTTISNRAGVSIIRIVPRGRFPLVGCRMIGPSARPV
jgi:hypothetical protein